MTQTPPAKPKGKPKTFQCPACGGSITLKAVGITISAVCGSCSSVIDTANDNFTIIKKANEKTRPTLLELGTRGRFRGIDWEVVGYMEKTDGSGEYHWDEYLLYNPYHGFRFLVQAMGHWNFVKVLRRDIPSAGTADQIWIEDKKFSVFLRGDAIVHYVKGEFYWRAKKGERTYVADYIAPPMMLSFERNNQEINLSLGEYLTPNEVADAFNIKRGMPSREGVSPNQPPPLADSARRIRWTAFLGICGAILIQCLTVAIADSERVYQNNLAIAMYEKDQTYSSLPFTIPKDGNVRIDTNTQLENDWLELQLSLVNDQTAEEYEVAQAVEYYHGYDGGESWSEGSRSADSFISTVPAGNYRLLIDTDAGAFLKGAPAYFTVTVTRDVPNWSNFWLVFFMLISYPVFVIWRRWKFECKRWSESDYGPSIYKSSSGDDE